MTSAGNTGHRMLRGGARVDREPPVATAADPRHGSADSSNTQRRSGGFSGTAQPVCVPGSLFCLTVGPRGGANMDARWLQGQAVSTCSQRSHPCHRAAWGLVGGIWWLQLGCSQAGVFSWGLVLGLPVISPFSQKLWKWIQKTCSHPRKCTTAAPGGQRGHPRVVARPVASCSHCSQL